MFALALAGADISGIWSAQTTDRNGDPLDISFRFAMSGDTLTGKMYGDNESTAITDAKVTGNQITFSVTTELNGQISKFVYTGTIKGDEIEATRERTGTRNGFAGGDPKRQNQKQSIRLKRVA
jgi:hypothetical protein